MVARVGARASGAGHDLYVAVDAGPVVNPDGVRNQVEGGARAGDELGAERAARASTPPASPTATGTSYPILRFSEVPEVHVTCSTAPDEPPLGVGEIAQAARPPAAIANALAHALGVRVRDLPMTFDRVAQAIGA